MNSKIFQEYETLLTSQDIMQKEMLIRQSGLVQCKVRPENMCRVRSRAFSAFRQLFGCDDDDDDDDEGSADGDDEDDFY